MNLAIAIVPVADRAVKLVIRDQPLHRLAPCGEPPRSRDADLHAGRGLGGARPHKVPVCLDQTRIARLKRPQGGIEANVRELVSEPQGDGEQRFLGIHGGSGAVDENLACHILV